ncbi:MAG: HDOD domain-containing protein [Gammaproteobacteria bacterium]
MSDQYQEFRNYSATPDELVSGIVSLVSLPEVYLRVNEMLDDPNTTAKAIGKVLSQDTGLTARLLRVANNPLYGYTAKVDTVSRAVSVVGLRELRKLVLSASAMENFSKIPSDVLNMVRYWRHSVYCGVVAQLLAERCNVLHSERLFIAGLLHDIGKLVIAERTPNQARESIEVSAEKSILDFEAEKLVMGYNHSEIGGKLLRAWRMPSTLCDAVEFHHEPLKAKNALIETCLVHIANAMTGMAERGLDADNDMMIEPVVDEAWKITGLDESIIESVLLEAGPLFTESLESILPRSYQSY